MIWREETWRAWWASLRRPGFLLLASGVPWSWQLVDEYMRTRAVDPVVFGPVVVLVATTTLLAALAPLLRALRIDPAVALRYE